jgi:hypothetical protein
MTPPRVLFKKKHPRTLSYDAWKRNRASNPAIFFQLSRRMGIAFGVRKGKARKRLKKQD